MKKLTKSKRDIVRFLLKRALNDLKVAKDYTFKAYGSSETTFDIKFAIGNLESALSNLPKTKLPRKEAKGSECPVKGDDCPMQKKPEKRQYTPEELEAKFKEVICSQLNVGPEKCVPEASFVNDLGIDSLDGIELIMAFEKEFGICLPEEDADLLTTYGKALEYVKKRVVDCSNKETQGESNK